MSRVLVGFIVGVAVTAGLMVGAFALASTGGGEIRVNARVLENGTFEVAVQQRHGGEWSQRQFPRARLVLPDAEIGRWYTSSPIPAATVSAALPDQTESTESAESTSDSTSGSNPDSATTGAQPGAYYLCLITHEQENDDDFWDLLHRGAERYAEANYAHFDLFSGPTVEEQARLLRECVDNGAQGIATTLPHPDGMADAIAEARAAGVVVNSFNSGVLDYERVGSTRHVGLDEVAGGRQAANLFAEHGVVGPILCITHEKNNSGLDQRCDGLEEEHEGGVVRFSVHESGVADLEATEAAIAAKLSEDSATPLAGVLTLSARIGVTALQAIAETEADLALATFDQNSEILRAIESGDVLFALDTLPWHQAWFVMSSLTADVYGSSLITEVYDLHDPFLIMQTTAVMLSPDLFNKENAGDWLQLQEQLFAQLAAAQSGN